jgi:oligoribonuclease (3'-5' exoribonuclease)
VADLQHQFLWIDLETTGVDPRAPDARILEWALVLADDDGRGATFEPVQQYTAAVHWPDADALRARCSPAVQRMHTVNGLWADVANPEAPSLDDADAFLASVIPGPGDRWRLAGFSVHFDLGWARVHLPRFAARLSHRVLDVSSLTAACATWGPGVEKGAPAHRALADVLASLDAARRVVAATGLGAP